MHFIVVNSTHKKNHHDWEIFPRVYIHESQWNDYSYRTVCLISIQMKKDSEVIKVGSTKIMYKGQRTGGWTFDEIPEFEALGSDFCSLAPDFQFYEKIVALGKTFASNLLAALRDVAYQTRIWALFAEDPCFRISLLRNTIKVANFRDDLKNLFSQRRVVRLAFKYELTMPGSNFPHVINFDFRKTSLLPHRVMLLVGKNGVGKTQLMANLAISMTGYTSVLNVDGAEKIINAGVLSPFPTFRALIAISFIVRTVRAPVLLDQAFAWAGKSYQRILQDITLLAYFLEVGNLKDRARLRSAALTATNLSEHSLGELIKHCAWSTLDAADIAALVRPTIEDDEHKYTLSYYLTNEVGSVASTDDLQDLTKCLLDLLIASLPGDDEEYIREGLGWLAEVVSEIAP